MSADRTFPHGTWPSPVSAADVARSDAPLEWVGFLGDAVCWVEARPEEGGRSALVLADDGGTREVLPGWNVRSKVIEYGGRPWAAVSARREDGLVLVDGADHGVHRWRPDAAPVRLTPAGDGAEQRYADFAVLDDEVWCVRETVADPEGRDVTRHIVSFPLDGSAAADPSLVVERAASHHFMTGPKPSPDGAWIAWIGWDHPDMPWDATQVVVGARPTASEPVRWRLLAGTEPESFTQIDWALDREGVLYAAGDRGGWWNIDAFGLDGVRRSLCRREEEFAEALWRIGQRWFAPLADGRVAVVHGTSGRALGLLSPDSGTLADIATGYTEWPALATDGRRLAAVAHAPDRRRTVLRIEPASGRVDVVRAPEDIHDAYATTPYLRTFHTSEGVDVPVHVYPPYHPGVSGPTDRLPPYVVVVHGGPTSRSYLTMSQEFTYFTSRGIGVVDIQYGGSTGFGRAYRRRLTHRWGLTDVEDAIAVAAGLVAEGLADPRRLAVRGGSAGGWTAARAVGVAPEVFRAAVVYYPVIAPELWRTEGTHDFESHYLESLLGPWPAAEREYRDRSPLTVAAAVTSSVLLLQGLADKVCPPAQAEALLDAAVSVPGGIDYRTFPDEGHGFAALDTLVTCLSAELRLYRSVFGDQDADEGQTADHTKGNDR
ncbi:prolyl oligopeptidase family serine peptidase [Streptomyces sp. NPDC057496]|uniref:prolyl oligopeptidase family serine peptidase n=1 Tax=Streptomyces sp. NPDC057496 TaxID=3346149 RepID=UPI0036A0E105